MPRPALLRARPPRPTAVRAAAIRAAGVRAAALGAVALGAAALLVVAPLAPSGVAAAQLLVDPAAAPTAGVTTTNITRLLSDLDDGIVVRPFADGFTFYGAAAPTVAVATNGYVDFGAAAGWVHSADRGIGELAASVEGPTAAVLYDDLVFDTRSALLEHIAPGHYQAYTFADVLGLSDPIGGTERRSTFQVAFFTGVTRVGEVDFLAGDVAFSYGALAHTISERTATVGVGRDALHYTALPGGVDGEFASLAALPGGGVGAAALGQRLVLLRPNANGGYDLRDPHDPRAQVTVPEPSSAALVAAGLGAAWAARRRRRAVPA